MTKKLRQKLKYLENATVENGRYNTSSQKELKKYKKTTDQLVYCQTSSKRINGLCLNKCQNILKVFSVNINVDLGRVLVLSSV